MKTFSIKYIIAVALVCSLGLLSSCRYNNPGEPPMPDYNKVNEIKPTHTISALKALYKKGGVSIEDEVIIKGQVATDDAEGNFYKSLTLQDETGGIEIKLNGANLGRYYPQGSTVVVHCKGLVLGQYGGQMNLGYRASDDKYENAFIPEAEIAPRIQLASLGTITSKVLTLSQVNKKYANTLVTIKGVQFIDSELGQTYANAKEKDKIRAVNRTLIDQAGKTIIVRTSSYARFAGNEVATGSGDITALLTYFGNTAQLVIIRERDVNLYGIRF